MECLQNRLESFAKPVRLQNSSKTGAWKSIKWPHPDTFVANPTALAHAGFYYTPSFDERDSVTCFVCDKEIDDWEADDDPFDIHWTKCSKTCFWAIVRCGLRQDMDNHGRYTFPDKNRLPTSKAMEKARLQTYSIGDGWIHDKTKNHGAHSKKMAKAGFVFTPQSADDDAATCLYCGISLSSWDSDDDPLEEHRKRKGTECAFFSGSSPPASTATTTKPRSSSKPNSRTSTATTRSTRTRGRSRSAMQDIIEDTSEPLARPAKPTTTRKPSRAAKKSVAPITEDDEDEDDEEQEVRARGGGSKTPRSRSTSRSVPRKPSSRLRKVAPVKEEPDDEEQEGEGNDDDEGKWDRVALKPSIAVEPDPELDDAPITTMAKSTSRSKKRSRSRKTTTTTAPVEEEGDDRGKSTLSRKRSSKPKSKKYEVSPPLEAYETAPEPEPAKNPKPTTMTVKEEEEEEVTFPPKKNLAAANAKAKVVWSSAEDEDERTSPPPQIFKKAMKPKSATKPPVAKDQDVEMEDLFVLSKPVSATSKPIKESSLVSQPSKPATKSKKSKPTVPESEPEPESEDEVQAELVEEVHTLDTQMQEPEADPGPLSFAPRLVAKVTPQQEQQRPKTPELPPIITVATPLQARPEPKTPVRQPTVDVPPPSPVNTIVNPSSEPQPHPQEPESLPPFVPFLSKLPFTPLIALSDAELDMTVEEWIRYQVEVEFDKFKRDGERELLRFRKKAEEVRKAIEGL